MVAYKQTCYSMQPIFLSLIPLKHIKPISSFYIPRILSWCSSMRLYYITNMCSVIGICTMNVMC